MIAPLPGNEAARLAALHSLGILDTPADEAFDDIVRLANQICGTSIGAVTLIDSRRQWFKAKVGFDLCETDRDHAICAHTILNPGELLVVGDLTKHPSFADNPFVTGAPRIRFYAGAALLDRDGLALGGICVMDTKPRELTGAQREGLTTLARQAAREIESRRLFVDLKEQKSALDQHAIVAIARADGRLSYVNDRFCELMERSRAALLAAEGSVTDPGHAAYPFFGEAWAGAVGGEVWRGEIRLEAASDGSHWIQATVVPLGKGSGRACEVVAIGTDITPQKRSEANLRRSEAWSRELIEALPVPIYTTDLAGRITMFNRAAVEFCGREPKVGSDRWCLSNLLYHLDGSRMAPEETSMARTLRHRRIVPDREAVAVRPDGSRVNFIPRPSLLRDGAGAIVGGINLLVDVTAQRRDEEALRLLGSALHQAGESVMITDARLEGDGPRVVFVNPAFTAMTGFELEDVVDGLKQLHGPMTDLAMLERLRAAQIAGTGFSGEIVCYRKDGTAFDLEWRMAPLREGEGAVTHFVSIQRDITRRKTVARELEEAREAALESSRLKTKFLAHMSHELRTPLNTINGLSATLVEQDLPGVTRQLAGMILGCGEALLETIQTILTHSALEAGKTVLDEKPFFLADVVLSALRITADAAQRKRVDLDCHLAPELPAQWVGDPFRLQQVLVNLLANAIKFTDQGQVLLRVRRRVSGDGRLAIHFTVADTGIGIRAADIAKLFQPFSQAEDSSRRFEGTGLGLAISKSLVDLMGGTIAVTSRPGRGSLFHFQVTLPVVADSPRVFARGAHPTLVGKGVLIVEPDAFRRRQLREMVAAWGLREVGGAADGESVPDCDVVLHRLAYAPRADETVPPVLLSLIPDEVPAAVPVLWLCPTAASSPPAINRRTGELHAPFGSVELSDALVSLLAPPRPIEAAGAERETGRPPERGKLGERVPLRVLAADDIAANRQVLRVVCEHLGYSPDLVENGAEVLQQLEAQAYDLILLDVQMPVMGGLDAAREICRRFPDPVRRPKMVAVTASAQPEDRAIGLAVGMDDYLVKPLLPKKLQSSIESLFTDKINRHSRPPIAVAAEQLPWVDESHLAAITEGLDARVAQEFIHSFYDAAKKDFGEIHPRLVTACAARKVEDARRCVHGLKGCVLSVGWSRMGQRCSDILLGLKENQTLAWDEFPEELAMLYRASTEAMSRILAADAVGKRG